MRDTPDDKPSKNSARADRYERQARRAAATKAKRKMRRADHKADHMAKRRYNEGQMERDT